MATRPALSLVVPAYDEVENLAPLRQAVREALGDSTTWELIIVDDGSRDGTGEKLRELAAADPSIRAVHHDRNRGQTSALATGIACARAPWIATLDADLQNDPRDLAALLDAVGDADAAVGYRVRRHDTLLRRVSSRVANRIRDTITGDAVRDTGCSLKLFRAEAIRAIPLFEGMHRFLPTLLRWYGFRIVEVPVSHRPRHAGRSKYGVRNRVLRASQDLLAVCWMRSRLIRPNAGELERELPGE